MFEVIDRLKQHGVAIIYVSHKIEEVLRIADRISVLRDGQYRGTQMKGEATVDKIIQMMVGRELRREHGAENRKIGPTRLKVTNLTGTRFREVSFDISQGEILGFAGLVGAGRSEVARAIFGAETYVSGQILLDGKPVQFHSPSDAIRGGLAMVQEDRKTLSLFMELPVLLNISVAQLPNLTRFGMINNRSVVSIAKNYVDKLNIKLGSVNNPVSSLSGGNQQKTILARWLATNPKLLILDEPTHGVDVGAKAEIYQLMRNLSEQGISIMLISSELPEILAMSDRVVVMHEGRVTGILDRENLDEHTDHAVCHRIGGSEWRAGSCLQRGGPVERLRPHRIKIMKTNSVCTFERADFRGWEAVYLRNGFVTLAAVPDIGGRVMAYNLGDYPYLFVDPDLAGKLFTAEENQGDGSLAAWKNYGGDKTWPSPQGWDNENEWHGPPDPLLDTGHYRLQKLEGDDRAATLEMVSPPDPRTGVQITRQVTLKRGGSRVTLDLSFRNISERSVRWSIWDVVQLNAGRALPGGVLAPETACSVTVPLNPRSRFSARF